MPACPHQAPTRQCTMKREDLQQIVRSHVESHYPIIQLVTFEEADADRMIKSIADERKILEWNMARGCVCFDSKSPLTHYLDLSNALDNWLDQELHHHFLVIKDACPALRDNPVAVARLKALANKIVDPDLSFYATIFLVASQSIVPPEIEKFITIFEPSPPDEEKIKRLIYKHGRGSVRDEVVPRLVTAFRGLSAYEISRLVNRGYQLDGVIGEDDIKLVRGAKKDIVKKSGILEMVDVSEGVDDIGGLEVLKTWLRKKSKVMNDLPGAREFGVESPKGVMIVGMPGCGKSLTAKATAALFGPAPSPSAARGARSLTAKARAESFGLPLLRLDVGALMGKYVGESESNMRRALKLAEAVSPCVLWVDEVEKAFAGVGGSGHDITRRLFGHFLTWMQEKTAPVFVVATANDIISLPSELTRKGRFDEIFRVDFPDETEREAILRVHLEKRKPGCGIDTRQLARETEGCSGADLESVVKGAIEQAFVEGKGDLTLEHLRCSAKDTVPMAKVMMDKKKEYDRKFREMGIKSASAPPSD